MADKEYYVHDFEDWAYENYWQFMKEKKASSSVRFIQRKIGNKVVLVDTLNGKMAIAKCRPDEKFHYSIGLGVAYARLKGKPIPKEKRFVELKTLKVGQRFTSMSGKDYTLIGASERFHKRMMICESVNSNTLHYFGISVFVIPKD